MPNGFTVEFAICLKDKKKLNEIILTTHLFIYLKTCVSRAKRALQLVAFKRYQLFLINYKYGFVVYCSIRQLCICVLLYVHYTKSSLSIKTKVNKSTFKELHIPNEKIL